MRPLPLTRTSAVCTAPPARTATPCSPQAPAGSTWTGVCSGCALYALEVSEEAYTRARRRADHMMAHGNLYRFNVLGLILCGLHIR